MATMNISLPNQMKEWVEAQTEDGRYSNASDVVRDLIRKEQVKAQKIATLQEMVQAGIDSGFSPVTREELFERAKAHARTVLGIPAE